jgi:hypothetical protein
MLIADFLDCVPLNCPDPVVLKPELVGLCNKLITLLVAVFYNTDDVLECGLQF